jgi:hypothetical protein
MKTIRPGWGPSALIMCAVLLGMLIALAVIQPEQVLWVLATAVGVAVIGWARLRAMRLEITESVVRAKQGWYLPEKQVARSEISAIHYFPRLISFRGPDRKPIMKIAPNWTLRQMLEVADELAVPLYDHRRWLGLRWARIGRLVSHPRQASRSADGSAIAARGSLARPRKET